VNIHEEKFVSSFVVKEKRGRYREFLSNEKHRYKITGHFDHCDDLDLRFVKEIPARQQNRNDVLAILRKAGADDSCWILSTNSDIDQIEMNLSEAINEYLFREGTFFSCIPGRLVLYSGEDINAVYILERTD
jgi:hypothetical protein